MSENNLEIAVKNADLIIEAVPEILELSTDKWVSQAPFPLPSRLSLIQYDTIYQIIFSFIIN